MTEYVKNKLSDIVNGMSDEEREEVLNILLMDESMQTKAEYILTRYQSDTNNKSSDN